MFEHLRDLEIHYEEVMAGLSDPLVTADQNRFRAMMKEQADLQPLVEAYRAYTAAQRDIEDAKQLLASENDEDLRSLAKEELADAREREEALAGRLKVLLLPRDPNDDKNIVLEIRAGVGGDEAALFASELFRMYQHYADARHWKVEIDSLNENGIGGFKEVIATVSGKGAYSRLKYESGVHRVQRVPETESGGRIHTSTASVAVMPEAEEFDVEIDMNDVRIDVMRASGNGGQCVNTTDSAVRLTHIPTGIVIYSQTEKSQLQNKDKAFRLLRSKLYGMELARRQEEEARNRRSQIGTGDRSEKIRTYMQDVMVYLNSGYSEDEAIRLTYDQMLELSDTKASVLDTSDDNHRSFYTSMFTFNGYTLMMLLCICCASTLTFMKNKDVKKRISVSGMHFMTRNAATIGGVTFVICTAGLMIGKKAGNWLTKGAGILGGVILIAIGLEIVVTHYI